MHLVLPLIDPSGPWLPGLTGKLVSAREAWLVGTSPIFGATDQLRRIRRNLGGGGSVEFEQSISSSFHLFTSRSSSVRWNHGNTTGKLSYCSLSQIMERFRQRQLRRVSTEERPVSGTRRLDDKLYTFFKRPPTCIHDHCSVALLGGVRCQS